MTVNKLVHLFQPFCVNEKTRKARRKEQQRPSKMDSFQLEWREVFQQRIRYVGETLEEFRISVSVQS